MKGLNKKIYVIFGFITLVLGIIGILLPILPTTPFLLTTSFCFAKGSDKFDRWFKGTKVYKEHLESFVRDRAMTLKQKLRIVITADIMIAIPFLLIDSVHVRILLSIVILAKLYYFIFKIKTIKTTAVTKPKELSKKLN